MSAWRADERPIETIEAIDVDDLAERLDGDEPPLLLDVRGEDEFEEAHIPGSVLIPFGELKGRLGELPRDRPIATICSGGKRSGLAASVLQREGFEDLLHVAEGGVRSWEERNRPVEPA
jgi:rhodanese-related sulfurtransferase